MSINKKLSDLKKAFVGISEFRYRATSADLTSDMTWDFELPILRDSFSFETSEPSFNETFIHGESVPYAATAEPGETTISFEVPSIDKDITDWLLTPAESSNIVGISDSVGGVKGTWSGSAYKMDNKAIQGMIMIISDDKTKAIVIKNFKGYASPNMSELTNTPVSFTISATLESSQSEGTQGDILFLDFAKS